MNSIYRDIFRAIHEGLWLSIEYCNREERLTRYWIGIRGLNVKKRTLAVDGLHLGLYTTDSYEQIYIDSILSAKVVEGSYCPVNRELVEDIYRNPHKYHTIFDHAANLKILNYLEMCSRMDQVPYYANFELVRYLDRESFQGEEYWLSDEQFQFIVRHFQYRTEEPAKADGKLKIQQLAINVLSIHTQKGLYVLACRKLRLDVKNRLLRPDEDITICTEWTIDGEKENIRRYLDAEEYELLRDFEANQEKIKDCVARHNKRVFGVDDMPYIIGLGMDVLLDLHKEYEAIIDMYQEEQATVPIRAFFGDLLRRPVRRKEYPIALMDQKVNLDQLLAINHAMKYPLAYIQGPPGTGKTNTIINTILTAFFNEKTVLFVSYNNHPLNSVCEKLSNMEYLGRRILFPVLRLGNMDKVREALAYMKELYTRAAEIRVYEKTLDRNRKERIQRAGQLSGLLKRYEEILDLEERRDTLNRLLAYEGRHKAGMQMLSFETDLQGRQLGQVERRLAEAGQISGEEALRLLDNNTEEFKKYLYYTSAQYVKKLDEPKNRELKAILLAEEGKEQLKAFTKYLSQKENIKRLQKIFPVIVTTCISAHRLGEAEPMFDMVIMDEASQCNTAVALVPIVRGEQLMLVGDPQQLNPVILLDELTNEKLKKRYGITEEYDYRKNSIYKTYLACDAVSDEVLLHHHYRCHPKIIGFNNQKYYHSRLDIHTDSLEKQPLLYIDVTDSQSADKNTAPAEVAEIIRYAAANPDQTIGVITPFVNQRKLIEEELKKEKLTNAACGTVHAFQGDEKEVVLFSTALTEQTQQGTYEWLKNNKELINVATSRARDRLVVLGSTKELERLHNKSGEDDLYELIRYVRQNGQAEVTQKQVHSRALGVKPYSTETEEAFLRNLNHALENIWLSQSRFAVQREVEVSKIFQDNKSYDGLFYSGKFDFVVYEQQSGQERPLLAIELDGKEHLESEAVRERDRQKKNLCSAYDIQIIRVENSYARRYNYIKEILINYFSVVH